ncbi:STAS domain-containing protein [Lignipirellula cremea]|uniref:STAS domain protein n=1 Tax=Lignipirellula cremea TaxID=2528010 RepID=A0A518E2M4_9BACT|nr:STAS domain-containing protein [Lignipirellula cremea]QDU98313.1 STAS domain protein [Lignipirellula cremea]
MSTSAAIVCFSISTDHCDDMATVAMQGTATVDQVARIARRLHRIAARRPRIVLFDWRELKFLTSLALGVLVTFARQVRRHGGSLHIDGCSGPIREMLEVTRFDRFFEEIQ